jgi:hypothetical protein
MAKEERERGKKKDGQKKTHSIPQYITYTSCVPTSDKLA